MPTERTSTRLNDQELANLQLPRAPIDRSGWWRFAIRTGLRRYGRKRAGQEGGGGLEYPVPEICAALRRDGKLAAAQELRRRYPFGQAAGAEPAPVVSAMPARAWQIRIGEARYEFVAALERLAGELGNLERGIARLHEVGRAGAIPDYLQNALSVASPNGQVPSSQTLRRWLAAYVVVLHDPIRAAHVQVAREAVALVEARAQFGITVSLPDALRAVVRGVEENQERFAEQREFYAGVQSRAAAAIAYQDKMAAAGVQVSTAEAVMAVRSGEAARAVGFVEESAMELVARDPSEMPRAIRMYQAEMARLGITLNAAQAAAELENYLERLGITRLLLDQELRRAAEAVGLTKTELAREVAKEQRDWQALGAPRTSLEVARRVIDARRRARESRPMTAEELARANFAGRT